MGIKIDFEIEIDFEKHFLKWDWDWDGELGFGDVSRETCFGELFNILTGEGKKRKSSLYI